jgi:hypothetical protein
MDGNGSQIVINVANWSEIPRQKVSTGLVGEFGAFYHVYTHSVVMY